MLQSCLLSLQVFTNMVMIMMMIMVMRIMMMMIMIKMTMMMMMIMTTIFTMISTRYVLGLSQGTVSELLSKPKSWDKLTEKGRDSYRKMHAWVWDDQVS